MAGPGEEKLGSLGAPSSSSSSVSVEWSLGKPPDFVIELWGVEATIIAIIEAAAYKNPKVGEILAMLTKRGRDAMP